MAQSSVSSKRFNPCPKKGCLGSVWLDRDQWGGTWKCTLCSWSKEESTIYLKNT